MRRCQPPSAPGQRLEKSPHLYDCTIKANPPLWPHLSHDSVPTPACKTLALSIPVHINCVSCTPSLSLHSPPVYATLKPSYACSHMLHPWYPLHLFMHLAPRITSHHLHSFTLTPPHSTMQALSK